MHAQPLADTYTSLTAACATSIGDLVGWAGSAGCAASGAVGIGRAHGANARGAGSKASSTHCRSTDCGGVNDEDDGACKRAGCVRGLSQNAT